MIVRYKSLACAGISVYTNEVGFKCCSYKEYGAERLASRPDGRVTPALFFWLSLFGTVLKRQDIDELAADRRANRHGFGV